MCAAYVQSMGVKCNQPNKTSAMLINYIRYLCRLLTSAVLPLPALARGEESEEFEDDDDEVDAEATAAAWRWRRFLTCWRVRPWIASLSSPSVAWAACHRRSTAASRQLPACCSARAPSAARLLCRSASAPRCARASASKASSRGSPAAAPPPTPLAAARRERG